MSLEKPINSRSIDISSNNSARYYHNLRGFFVSMPVIFFGKLKHVQIILLQDISICNEIPAALPGYVSSLTSIL